MPVRGGYAIIACGIGGRGAPWSGTAAREGSCCGPAYSGNMGRAGGPDSASVTTRRTAAWGAGGGRRAGSTVIDGASAAPGGMSADAKAGGGIQPAHEAELLWPFWPFSPSC